MDVLKSISFKFFSQIARAKGVLASNLGGPWLRLWRRVCGATVHFWVRCHGGMLLLGVVPWGAPLLNAIAGCHGGAV